MKEQDREILDRMRDEYNSIVESGDISKNNIEREVHIISGLNQVLLRTTDRNDNMDYLIDRALLSIDRCKSNEDKSMIYGEGGI